MKPIFDEVVIFCPQAITGGPHALHQLGNAINKLGGSAKMLYTSEKAQLNFNNGMLTYKGDLNPEFMAAYRHYEPVVFSSTPLTPRTLVVVPEVAITYVHQIPNISKAVWWLSVDNALMANQQKFRYAAFKKAYFGINDVFHLYQSEYARQFLQENRAEKLVPLFDYTEPPAPSYQQAPAGKAFQYAYFPRKGGEMAAAFKATAGNLKGVAIENMPHEAVFQTLRNSSVYLDFGHHPGKDRVPREAALSGCVVLLHDMGAASMYGDHPLDSQYKFMVDDVLNGNLAKKVEDIVKNPAEHFRNQAYYRQKIRLEKEEFMLQVKSFFFHGD